MKQIFDWMREQIEKASIDVCCGCGTSESKQGIFLGSAEYIINEAEAKWEVTETEIRAKAIDDFHKALEELTKKNWIDHLEYGITWAEIDFVREQLKEE